MPVALNSDYPIPTRDQLQRWASEVAQGSADGDITAAELIAWLRDMRRAARDLGWLADVVLLLAREHGGKLPALAAAWSASGNRLLVHGPDARLKRLTDRYENSATALALFLALPPDPAPVEEPGETDT